MTIAGRVRDLNDPRAIPGHHDTIAQGRPEEKQEPFLPGTRHLVGIKVVDIINLSSSAYTLLRNRVRMMRSAGVDNHIICIDGRYVPTLRQEGIPVATVRLPRGYNVLKLVVSLFEIAIYLRREKVDLVHTHCPIPGFIGRLAAWVARVPTSSRADPPRISSSAARATTS